MALFTNLLRICDYNFFVYNLYLQPNCPSMLIKFKGSLNNYTHIIMNEKSSYSSFLKKIKYFMYNFYTPPPFPNLIIIMANC